MKLSSIAASLALALAAAPSAQAGLLMYGLCQTGCNGLASACYSAAGFKFGTVTVDKNTPDAILKCNNALGDCQARCAKVAGLKGIPKAS